MVGFEYFPKGLAALARAPQASTLAGHLGAAVVAGYFLGEDQQLQVGKQVKAFWNKDGFYYQGEGIITQLGRDNVTVKLQKRVEWSDDFTAGRSVRIPRVHNSIDWNTRNCVRLIRKKL